jgi:hypothetical protein
MIKITLEARIAMAFVIFGAMVIFYLLTIKISAGLFLLGVFFGAILFAIGILIIMRMERKNKIYCPKCKMLISDDEVMCKYCGQLIFKSKTTGNIENRIYYTKNKK